MRSGLTLAAIAACGCSLLDSVDDYAGPAASGGSAAGVDAGGSAATGGSTIGGSAGWAPGGSGGSLPSGGSGGSPPSGGSGGSPPSGGSGGSATGGTGGCSSDTQCSDGNACNGSETCSAGQCQGGTPPQVDDGNPCTTDYCDSQKGVQHVMGNYPSIKQCIAVTDICPADYYRAQYTCCDPECGACPYYVNAQICERACASEVQVCCGDLESKCASVGCPSGYSKAGQVSANCLCGTAGFAVVCKR